MRPAQPTRCPARTGNTHPLAHVLAVGLCLALWLAGRGALAEPAWQQIGPPGGDLFGVERSPDAPGTLFALSFVGVFRTTDGAASWEPVAPPESGFGTLALAFDRGTPDRVFLGSDATGIWKSDDLGGTWEACAEGLPNRPGGAGSRYPVVSLEALPDGKLFAGLAQPDGEPAPPAWIYRSDGGCTWAPDDAGITVDTAQPLGQDVAVLLTQDVTGQLWSVVYGAGVHRYAGGAWTAQNGDLPDEALRATFLAEDPQDATHWLLGTERAWVYETTNAGATWSALALPTDLEGLAELPLVYDIAIDPVNPEFVYVLAHDATTAGETPVFSADLSQTDGRGGYVTPDGGVRWANILPALARVVIDPAETVSTSLPFVGSVLRSRDWIATSYGGENLRGTTDGLVTLESWNAGLTSVLVNRVWLDPTPSAPNERMLFTGAEEGISLRRDDEPSWTLQRPTSANLYTWSFADDPTDDALLLYGTGHPARLDLASRGVYRVDTSCFGEGCEPAAQLLSDVGVWRVVTTPAQPDVIYLGTQEEGILKSTDRGETWAPMNQGLALPQGITDVALDAAGNPLLAAARTSNGDITAEPPQQWLPMSDEPGGVFRRSDGQWAAATGITSGVYALAAHPADSQRFFAAAGEGLFESTDSGATWQASLTTATAHDVRVDPSPPHYVYVATGGGVLRSTDGGVQFHLLTQGLWNPFALTLAVDPDDGTVYVGTLGGSVFALPPDPSPVASVRIDPPDYVFDVTPAGFSIDRGVTLTNLGEANLEVTGFGSSDPAFTVVEPAAPFTLTPRSAVSLKLRFAPAAAGPVAGTLVIDSNDAATPAFVYPVAGEGREPVPPAADLLIDGQDSPPPVPFGKTIAVSADLTVGDYLGRDTELWIEHVRPDGSTRWLLFEQGWVESSTPLRFYETQISDQSPLLSVSVGGLSSGRHAFTLSLDDGVDGVFDATWSDTAQVDVELAPPVLLTETDRVSFGEVPLGFSGMQFLGIANTGEADLVIDRIELAFGEFSVRNSPTFPLTLPFGATALALEFKPDKTGPSNNQLVLHTNDPTAPTKTVELNGTGVAPVEPTLDLKLQGGDEPVSIQRGEALSLTADLLAGDYAGRSADIWFQHARPDGTNAWLVLGSGWVESAAPLAFRTGPIGDLVPFVQANLRLTEEGEHTFTFSLDDDADGQRDATWSDAATATVELRPPALFTWPRDALPIGGVRVGAAKTQAFTIVNTGEADLEIRRIDTEAPEFEIVSPTTFPLTLPRATPQQITIRFTPLAQGDRTTTITLRTNTPSPATHPYEIQAFGRP